jgi:hypothetical protein
VHFVHSSLIFLKDTFEAEGANAMNFQMATLQPAAKTPSDAEGPDLPTDALSSAEMDVEIAPLVLKVGASSIAEFEKLLSELQEAKLFLQSEGERVQRETAQYIDLARAASASATIISDSVREWREAGHPLSNRAHPRLLCVPKTNEASPQTDEACFDFWE